MSGIDYYWCF